jgi:signal transduction histidine kinase
VWDRGPGIPADLRERIFDEYTRFDKQGKEGAGLGLAISRRLAHALGGELVVESQHGAGSRFVLWLPASAAAAA